jgi:uracil-DNA glycosylase
MNPAHRGGAAVEVAAAAAAASTWSDLADAIAGCTACADLVASRTRTVPGVCPPGARLMLIGEGPGATEDAQGVPFVGRAGQLLDELLAAAGVARADVAVANVVKCRPPANRTPTRAEAATCRPWLQRQLDLATPELVVTLGGTAAQWALGPAVRLGAARGRVHDVDGRAVVVTYHPSAALRFGPNGAPRAALAHDLHQVAELLKAPGIDRGATW